MNKKLTSVANGGRADGRGICYALLHEGNTIAVSLPSSTFYLAITLTIFNNGSICPRKKFTLLCATAIFPPTDERIYCPISLTSEQPLASFLSLRCTEISVFRAEFRFCPLSCSAVLLCACLWLWVLVSLYQGLPCWSLQKVILAVSIDLLHQFIVPWKSRYTEMAQCISHIEMSMFF